MVSQRHTPLSSTATLTSQPSTCTLPPRTSSSSSSPLRSRSSPSSPLGLSSPSSSSSFSSFSSSSTTSSKKKKRTRKSLAEEQELYRIMDPTYLGQSPSSRWNGHPLEYHADPEGYWHDIDYKPFMKIKENENVKRRCFTTSSFSSSSSTTTSESESVFGRRGEGQRLHSSFGRRKGGSGERVAYWETFTPSSYRYDVEEKSYPTLLSSPSYYHSYPDSMVEPSGAAPEIGDDDEEGEEGTDTRRVLLKKKNIKKDSLDSLTSSTFSSSSSSSSLPSSSSSSKMKEDTEQTTKPKPQDPKPKSQNTIHKKWVTTTFIARLKVIRTKRWLKDRVTF